MKIDLEPGRRPLKILFFGTPDFASDVLNYLFEHQVPITAIVTQPDRPQGRSLKMTPPAVKALVLEKAPHLPIFQPEKASDPQFLQAVAQLKPDLFVVVVFGQILPQTLLAIPKLGSINVHPSLLPKFRGAAPIRRALMEGETETGVVIQKMVRQMDAGDLLAVEKINIDPNMTHGELEEKLLTLSKPLLLQVIRQYEKGEQPPGWPQDPEKATFAPKISAEEGEIHWGESAQKIHNQIRALSPRPGAWSLTAQGKRIKILRSVIASGTATGAGKPGAMLSPKGIFACGHGSIQLIEVQPEGKKPMSAAEWIRGQKETQIFTSI
ncbi:MAG: methionyl-tRNA formyltransferase [Verrucomicrobia bacterium]|nr:methionyl-tRNA formyltransferase [Verrucomicrobiota bacterium]MBU6446841.1 methionyl-tRNA formyltransferase [Verrucomicrobiota bacterium]MDE3046745.1 methionyl-tRNA formyltransferase [Verrucomicrobiota bacterium]